MRRLPSTSDVSRVTVAALRRPAGKFRPIFSSLSRSARPPFFDLALRSRSSHITSRFSFDFGPHRMHCENAAYCYSLQQPNPPEMDMGHILFTQPNPTHQLTDPTQPSPSYQHTDPPNPELLSISVSLLFSFFSVFTLF